MELPARQVEGKRRKRRNRPQIRKNCRKSDGGGEGHAMGNDCTLLFKRAHNPLTFLLSFKLIPEGRRYSKDSLT